MSAITYSNGTTVVGPYDAEKFAQAVADPKVVKACIYRPGEIITMSDRKYRVGNTGNLIRIRD